MTTREKIAGRLSPLLDVALRRRTAVKFSLNPRDLPLGEPHRLG